MKIIVINKKRVKITSIIIVLMIILFSAEKIFDGKLKFVALVNSNLDALKQHTAIGGKFTYKLPEDWETKETDFSSKDIIYHNDFNSKDQKIYGVVQVWKSKGDLKTFLDKSKEVSSKQNKISDYDLQSVEINNNKGYVVYYSMKNPQNILYIANEFFIDEGDSFIRFSFFVSEKNYKENMQSIFKGLVTTFKYEK